MINVSVKDFGPIIEANVNLKPLTVFVGPSNAGKSYMAMLIYSLMQSLDVSPLSAYGVVRGLGYRMAYRPSRRRGGILRQSDPVVNDAVLQAAHEWFSQIDLEQNATLDRPMADLPVSLQDAIVSRVGSTLESFVDTFATELERSHAKIADLSSRRQGAEPFQVSVSRTNPRLDLALEEQAGSLKMREDTTWDNSATALEIPFGLIGDWHGSHAHQPIKRTPDLDMQYRELMEVMASSAAAALFEGFPTSCYYLPAARSGIAQGHKAIASILVRQSSFAAIRPLEIPTLSGIITDFMGHILTMERAGALQYDLSSREIQSVVNFLEQKVVRGKIGIDRSGEVTYPEISYEPNVGQPLMGQLPFHRTSSMVSELAPVILFLKYLVRQGDMVILEEPESHLHPASQREMARAIVRLVNAKVNVIVTTHSDYFMGQLNNLLMLSRVPNGAAHLDHLSAADQLNPKDVVAYDFKIDDSLGGSMVEELPVDPDVGIAEEDFRKVAEELYEETIGLQETPTS